MFEIKKILGIGVVLLLVLGLSGCAFLTGKSKKRAGSAVLPAYSGLKARLAVGDFEVKAAKATTGIGSGLREMLVVGLIKSNRFSVVENQVTSQVIQEQGQSTPSAAQDAGSPTKTKAKTADLMIGVAVADFEPLTSGGRSGVGGGGGVGRGVLGALLGVDLSKAHMALDIRIVDTATSQVLASTRVQGQASEVAGGFMAGFFGSSAFKKGSLSAYANTPMEKAITICLVEAVRYIAQAAPAGFYKY